MRLSIAQWVKTHPARAGTLAGWYQQGCSAFGALVAIPLIIKLLDQRDAGLWFAFQATLAAVSLADFGVSFVLSRQIAYSIGGSPAAENDRGDFLSVRPGWGGVSDVYAVGCRIFRWICLAGVLLLIVIYHVVLPQGRMLVGADPATVWAWYLLGLSALLGIQVKPHQSLLEGLGRLYLTRIFCGTYFLLSGLIVVAILLAGGGLLLMAVSAALLSLLNYAVTREAVRRVAGGRLELPRPLAAAELRRMGRVAVPLGVLSLSGFLVSSIQVPLLGSILGARAVPPFYIAQRLGQSINLAVLNLMNPQLPLFTQELGAGRKDAARTRMARAIVWVTGIAAAANAFFWLATPALVDWWTGSGTSVGRDLLTVMAIDYFILSSAVAWGFFVLASGSNPFMWTTLASGLANVALCVWLVDRFGLIGAPLATLATGIALNYWYNPWQGWKLFANLRREGGM